MPAPETDAIADATGHPLANSASRAPTVRSAPAAVGYRWPGPQGTSILITVVVLAIVFVTDGAACGDGRPL